MSTLTTVGQRVPRTDAAAKVTGQARYTADMRRPDMLIAGACFAPHPHARIKKIDVSDAEAFPGVVAVMTAKDLPGRNAYGLLCPDKPVIADVKTRYEGDPVAILAAETEEAARKAVELVRVEYEPLPVYDDPREAMEDGATFIHEKHPVAERGNLLTTVALDCGDVEKAFAEAAVVIENDYETPMVEHCYLEPDVCIAEPNPLTGGLTLTSPSQAVYATRRNLAPVFGIPQHKLHVVSPLVGGGFGGKEDSTLDVCVVAGVLALKTGRTVFFELNREEIFRTTGKRHASYIRHRLAADATGRILGMDIRFVLDKGAYVSLGGMKEPFHAVTMRTVMYAAGPYAVPNARVRSHSVFTNHPYSCAFRGFGAPQAAYAMECQMDELAHRLGLDLVEVRRRNMLRAGDRTITGQVMLESRGLGLEECLDRVLERMEWNDRPVAPGTGPIRRGRGLGLFLYGTGVPMLFEGASCFATLQLDGTLNINVGSTEMGQGLTTALAQIASELLGIPLDDVQVDISDTALAPDSGPTVGSRSVVLVGNAVTDACFRLRERLLDTAARYFFQTDVRNLQIGGGRIFESGKPERSRTFVEVVLKAFNTQVPLSVVGSWYPPQATFRAEDGQGNPCHAYSFGAHGVEVEVDVETGSVSITRSVLACDVGKAINPVNVEGQMEGGAAQAIGWSVMEESILERGVMNNAAFHNYLIPTSRDLPLLESIIVECPNELGPFGAKGVGEPPIVGGAPAIRNAVRDALGFPINGIPLTARQVLLAIRTREQCQGGER